MFENTVLCIITVLSTVRTVSYGVWTIKRKNIIGGISIIFMSLIALSLVTIYIAGEII